MKGLTTTSAAYYISFIAVWQTADTIKSIASLLSFICR
jgi:hypothetical protein